MRRPHRASWRRRRARLSGALARVDRKIMAVGAGLALALAIARPTAAWHESTAEPAAVPGALTDPILIVQPSRQVREELIGPVRGCGWGVELSVLVSADGIQLGTTVGQRLPIPAAGGAHDWQRLEASVAELAALGYLGPQVDVAATDEVSYFTLLEVLAVLQAGGFTNLGVARPGSLVVRFPD